MPHLPLIHTIRHDIRGTMRRRSSTSHTAAMVNAVAAVEPSAAIGGAVTSLKLSRTSPTRSSESTICITRVATGVDVGVAYGIINCVHWCSRCGYCWGRHRCGLDLCGPFGSCLLLLRCRCPWSPFRRCILRSCMFCSCSTLCRLCKIFLVAATFHICLVVLGYAVFSWMLRRPVVRSANGFDSYYNLFDYNKVKIFHGDAEMMNRSAASDAFFEKIQRTDGVVAVDTLWALQNNLAPSVSHPEDSTKSIYQIDMFHSIHCVYRIRNLLTSSLSLEEWPRNDEHTLHCLDYIREQLMCNSDLTLEATDNLVMFKKNNGHVCRDSDAIMEWALRHSWDGHRQYLKETIGFE